MWRMLRPLRVTTTQDSRFSYRPFACAGKERLSVLLIFVPSLLLAPASQADPTSIQATLTLVTLTHVREYSLVISRALLG